MGVTIQAAKEISPASNRFTENRTPTIELALGIAGLLAVFFPVLFLDHTYTLRDLLSFHRPLAHILVRLMHEGDSLQWNPWLADGQPFAANPNSLAHHPISLLFHLMPFEWAFRFLVILPVVVSGCSMTLLLRSLQRTWVASVFGGVAWCLSGAVLSTSNLLPSLLALAPLPAVAGLTRFSVQNNSKLARGCLALMFGVQAASGEPALLLATGPVILAALYSGATKNLKPVTRWILPLCAGLLLGSATLIPAAALAQRTVRAEGLTKAEAESWSFPPVRIAELIFPNAMGDATKDRENPGWYFGGALYGAKGAPYIISIYGCALVVLLAIAGFHLRFREEFAWLVLFACAFLMAAGSHTPVFGILRSFGPLAALRYPERFILIAALALIPPAARGFDLVLSDPEGQRSFVRILIFCAVLSVITAAALFLVPVIAGVDCWARFGLVPQPIAADVAHHLPIDALRPAIIALCSLAILRFCGQPRGQWTAPLFLLVVIADVSLGGRNLIESQPVHNVLAPPPPLAALAKTPPAGTLYHAAVFDRRHGYAVRLAPPPETAIWNIATTLDPDFDRAQLRWTSRGSDLVRSVLQSDPVLVAPLLARRGVAAVLTFQGEPNSSTNPLRLLLLRPTDQRPLVFVADTITNIQTQAEWLAAVRNLGPAAARSAVIEQAQLANLPRGYGKGFVQHFDASPGHIHASVRVESGSWVMLAINQSWDDGWRASIDHGPEILVLRIDLSLIGVPIRTGTHEVDIHYTDPWDRRGKVTAFIGAFLSLLFFLPFRKTQRLKRHSY